MECRGNNQIGLTLDALGEIFRLRMVGEDETTREALSRFRRITDATSALHDIKHPLNGLFCYFDEALSGLIPIEWVEEELNEARVEFGKRH